MRDSGNLCCVDVKESSTAERVSAVHKKIDALHRKTGERVKKESETSRKMDWLVESVRAMREKHPATAERVGGTMRSILLGLAVVAAGATPLAQQPAIVGAQFDVVSIKPHKTDVPGGGMRREPDGTQIMTNVAVRQFIMTAATERVVDVVGLPDWANTEHYDLIAKPAPGLKPTMEQQAQMWRNLFADRMKLVAHIAEEERTTFALVLARSDGRLGPNLKKSELDCAAQAAQAAQRTPDGPPPDIMQRCGMRMGRGTIESGGIDLDRLVLSLRGLAGGVVNNRTGLEGSYALTLRYSLPSLNADPSAAPPSDDAPQFVTALQEQLGLKLVPEKTKVKIFVVDHIERPTPD